ncbi:MAG: hypothetical protein AAF411_20990 [Myxococcota bacterium]
MRFSAGFALLLLLTQSCTLSRDGAATCRDSSECRAAFGNQSVCGDDGFCTQAETSPRCSIRFPSEPAADTIFFGTIIDGSLATHEARARSVELAVRDASEAGGIDGRTFGLYVCTNEVNEALDTLTQDEASVSDANFLASVGAVALIGPPSSASTEAVFRNATNSLLIISPSASSVALTELEGAPSDEAPGRLWRTTPRDDSQVQRIAADLEGRSVGSVAIVHADDAYGLGIASRVEAELSGVTLFSYDSAARLSELIAEVGRRDDEEVMIVSSDTEEVLNFLLGAAASERFDAKTFFLTDAAANRDLAAGIMDQTMLFSRLRGTRPSVPDAATRDAFFARYQLTFEDNVRDLSFTTNSYDAAWIAIYASAWAIAQEGGELTATTLGRGLRRIASGPSVNISISGFDQVREAFARGESVDVIGTSGNLDYDPATEEFPGTFELWGVDASGLISLE